MTVIVAGPQVSAAMASSSKRKRRRKERGKVSSLQFRGSEGMELNLLAAGVIATAAEEIEYSEIRGEGREWSRVVE